LLEPGNFPPRSFDIMRILQWGRINGPLHSSWPERERVYPPSPSPLRKSTRGRKGRKGSEAHSALLTARWTRVSQCRCMNRSTREQRKKKRNEGERSRGGGKRFKVQAKRKKTCSANKIQLTCQTVTFKFGRGKYDAIRRRNLVEGGEPGFGEKTLC